MRFARPLSLAACFWLAGCGAPAQRPNLLLVSIDTLRADALACYGGPADVGERLCALGDAGTRYVWAFATAPTTSPSVASLLTSRWPPDHRVTQNLRTQLADETVTLAEQLKAAGYATGAVVSNPMLDAHRQLTQGFDHYDDAMTRRERNRPDFAERDAAATTDAALAWLRERAREPWFLWVHYQDPHGPYEPPDRQRLRDADGDALLPVLADDSGRGGIPRYQALPGLRSRVAYVRRYRDEVRYLDRELGRLLDAVDAAERPPAVLVTADHGEALGEDGYYFAHGQSAGLEQLRVPLLWRPSPGASGPGVSADPVSLVDVAPTLLFAAGAPPPPHAVGQPLQVRRDSTRELFADAERQSAVIREDAYYARDRRPGAEASVEGRAWGVQHAALPPRSARLPADGALPAYDVSAPPLLEGELARYIAAHPMRGPESQAEIPAELRRQLEALGYGER